MPTYNIIPINLICYHCYLLVLYLNWTGKRIVFLGNRMKKIQINITASEICNDVLHYLALFCPAALEAAKTQRV